MLNYEIFMKELRKAILTISGWKAENVTLVPKEDNKLGEDRLEIVCIESATHVGCDSLSAVEIYQEYLNGIEIRAIAEELVTEVRKKAKNRLFHAMVQIVDYEKARPLLFVATESINNKAALEHCIYKTVGDIALVVNVNLIAEGKNMIGLKVSQELLDVWEKEQEQVFQDALENSARMFPARHYDLLLALISGTDYDGEDFMNEDCTEILSGGLPEKCISTLDFNRGSVAIFYPGVAERLCQYLQTENLYIIFLSVKGILVRPAKSEISVEELKARAERELGDGQSSTDRLTDEIYYYDGKKHCIRRADGEGDVFQCR